MATSLVAEEAGVPGENHQILANSVNSIGKLWASSCTSLTDNDH